MGVLLYNETLESSLPDMTTRSKVLMVSTDMACHEPLHPLAQVLSFSGRYQQMKMIWDQAISIQLDMILLDRVQKQFLKCTIILRLMEHLLAAIRKLP